MGRREQSIRPCSRSLHTLAAWLRDGREAAGLTYEQLAAHTPFSADTLARAVSGSSVPRNVEVVVAYAQACGLSGAEAEKYWKLARRDAARAAGVLNGQRSGIHISVVKDFADLRSAIVELYQSAGSPALRSLDDRIGGHGRLPHSTVSRVLNGQSRPNRSFVLAFTEAVNVRRSEVAEWGKAWDRADRDRRSTRSRRMPAAQGDFQDRLTKHDRVTPRDLQLLMSDLEAFAHREPGIKLLVIPEAGYTETYGPASRMTRELLVDQAQRQGDLSCPRCRRPSFGYDDSQGWRAELCTDCTTPSALSTAAPSTAAPSTAAPSTAAPSVPEPRQILVSSSVPPRLPQRVPGQSWPPPGLPVHFGTLDADVFEAVGAPPEVCCRLCRDFHEAVEGCRPPAGVGEAVTAGHGRTAPANQPAAAGDGSEEEKKKTEKKKKKEKENEEKEKVPSGMRELDAVLGAAVDAPHGGGPPGARDPSVMIRATIGFGAPGAMPVAWADRREPAVTAPASAGPP